MSELEAQPEPGSNEHWVPRKSVNVQVKMADRSLLRGVLYIDVQRIGGEPGCVLDRLNEADERYLPLGTETGHMLLNKSRIVTAKVHDQEEALGNPESRGGLELHLRIRLTDRSKVEGFAWAILPPADTRALDFLNIDGQRFLGLHHDSEVVLINSDYIVSVVEI